VAINILFSGFIIMSHQQYKATLTAYQFSTTNNHTNCYTLCSNICEAQYSLFTFLSPSSDHKTDASPFLCRNASWKQLELDGKYSERVQLTAKATAEFFDRYVTLPLRWRFSSPNLATLATPTIRSIKCKQSPVYGVF